MEKIKILAFGCSHSLPAFDLDETNIYGENSNPYNDSIFDLVFADDERFDVTIISCPGQGILSFYQILYRLLKKHQWADRFDKIIVQQTTEPRWMFYSDVALDNFARKEEKGINDKIVSNKNSKHFSLTHETQNGLYDKVLFKMEFQIRASNSLNREQIDTRSGSIRFSPIFHEVPLFYYEKFFECCREYHLPVLSINFSQKSFTHCEPQYRSANGSQLPVDIPYLDTIIQDPKFKARDHANNLGVKQIAKLIKPKLRDILAD